MSVPVHTVTYPAGKPHLTSYPQPATVVVQSAPPMVNYKKSKIMLGLGITQSIAGALMLFLNIGAISVGVLLFGWSGVLVGVFVLITGSLCIGTFYTPNAGLVTASLVMSILASLGVWWVIANAIITIQFAVGYYSVYSFDIYPYFYRDENALMGFGVVMFLVGIIEFIVAILAAVAGCKIRREAATPGTIFTTGPMGSPSPQAFPAQYPQSYPQLYTAAPLLNHPKYLTAPPSSAGAPPSYKE